MRRFVEYMVENTLTKHSGGFLTEADFNTIVNEVLEDEGTLFEVESLYQKKIDKEISNYIDYKVEELENELVLKLFDKDIPKLEKKAHVERRYNPNHFVAQGLFGGFEITKLEYLKALDEASQSSGRVDAW